MSDLVMNPSQAQTERRPLYDTVVVALDGTPESADAIDLAASLAAASGAEFHTLSVTRDAVAGEMKRRVDRQLEERSQSADQVIIECVASSASAWVNDRLANDDRMLVVASNHGRTHVGELRGSFGENVLLGSGGPVLLVGPHCHRRVFTDEVRRRLVLAVDDPAIDERMASLVISWASALDLDVELLHIRERSVARSTVGAASWAHLQADLERERQLADDIADRLSAPVAFVEIEARTATEGIVAHAAAPDVALVVMGSHRRGLVERLVLGSAAIGVVRDAPCPVLIMRPAPLAG